MRSVNFVEKGAGRYVVGNVEPFDQKNEMFKRPFWDPEMRDLGEKFYFTAVEPREKPGYRLSDISAINASWRLEREFALGVRGGRTGFYAWDWDGKFGYPRIPSGLKIKIDDPKTNTQRVKKAAALFGVRDFCLICEQCAKKCPSKSIMFGEPTDKPHNISNRKGVMTWHINAETCLNFWADNHSDCSAIASGPVPSTSRPACFMAQSAGESITRPG